MSVLWTSLPSPSQRAEMWLGLDFTPVQENYPQTKIFSERLSESLLQHVPCFHHVFKIPENEMLRSYLQTGQVHESGFFAKFWLTRSVAAAFPYGLRDLNFYSPEVFKRESPYLLSGHLAMTLAAGGHYNPGRPDDGGVQAVVLGQAAADELIHKNYNDTRFYVSDVAWCDCFADCGYDNTWIVFDLTKMIVHVIFMTDFD